MSKKLTNIIQRRLLSSMQKTGYEIAIPNFYVGQFEMDLFLLKKSGYVYEYEIKTSISDFQRDFNKHFDTIYKEKILKHDLLRNGKRANRFFFVTPKDMIEIDAVPEHCGLIYYEESIGFYGGTVHSFNTVKNAPLLHRNKNNSVKFYKNLAVSLSFRESYLRNKLTRKENLLKTLKSPSL